MIRDHLETLKERQMEDEASTKGDREKKQNLNPALAISRLNHAIRDARPS